jgi:hypothetical protein
MLTPKQPVINAVLITYIHYSIAENYRVAQKERIAFPRCPLAPTLTRLFCLRFLSLGGYRKSKVYVRKPRTVDDLKVQIREEIANCATRNVSKYDAEL